MGRRPYVPKFTQKTLIWEQDNAPKGEIHFTWYNTIGVWISPVGHATAAQIAQDMIHIVQNRVAHNRKTMSKPEKWVEVIKEYCERYKLMEAT